MQTEDSIEDLLDERMLLIHFINKKYLAHEFLDWRDSLSEKEKAELTK